MKLRYFISLEQVSMEQSQNLSQKATLVIECFSRWAGTPGRALGLTALVLEHQSWPPYDHTARDSVAKVTRHHYKEIYLGILQILHRTRTFFRDKSKGDHSQVAAVWQRVDRAPDLSENDFIVVLFTSGLAEF